MMMRLAGGALCLASLLLCGFEMNNPNPMRWFALLCLVAALALFWTGKLARDGVTWAVLLFFAYAALSLTWSLDWREGIISLYQLFLLCVLFVATTHIREHLKIFVPLVASAAALLSLGISVFAPGIYGGLGNENFQAEFLCLLIPLICAGLFVPRVCVACQIGALVALAQLVFNGSDAKWAGAAGLAVLSSVALILARMFILSGALLASGAIGLCLKWSDAVTRSVLQRVELTYNTLVMWLDSPFFGVGIGSFGHAYPRYQEAHHGLVNANSMWGLPLMAGAAHNEYAQALAIFGLAGFSLLVLIGWLVWSSRATDALARCGLCAAAVLGGLCLVGFPMQNPATAILGVVALGVMVKVEPVGACSRRLWGLGHVQLARH